MNYNQDIKVVYSIKRGTARLVKSGKFFKVLKDRRTMKDRYTYWKPDESTVI